MTCFRDVKVRANRKRTIKAVVVFIDGAVSAQRREQEIYSKPKSLEDTQLVGATQLTQRTNSCPSVSKEDSLSFIFIFFF